ncbi:Replication factor C subunit 3 [Fusarium pseudoanthophilum]|uniref:Replication factor C subunit 3 n=1 Tax=Fusarium pseudoanthophilum TaxID=48495 RepID=A0A8H5NXW8_9HYPO|nr:Replication factor C subunit 3 [Fusarium pseudoanthophilum]
MSDPQRDAPPLSAHIPATTTTTTVLPTTNGSAKGDDVPDAGLRSLDHYKRALPKWRYNLRQQMLPLIRWETPYLAWMQEKLRTPALDSYFAITANLGTHTFFMIGLPICFWCGYAAFGKGLVHILALGVFWTGFIKDFYSLPRPLSPPLHRITMSGSAALEYGFPSTHSANAVSVAVYALLILRSPDNTLAPTTKFALECLSYFYAASIIFGRLYCGMHGFLDVIVGSIMGAAISLLEFYYGPPLDEYMHSSSWAAPLVAALIILVLVRIHPEPADDCPCYDDSVAFAGVVIGLEFGTWTYGKIALDPWETHAHGGGSVDITHLGLAANVARIVFGVLVVFAWRETMKPLLLKLLPHLFRIFEQVGVNMPRRFFTPASKYKTVPTGSRIDTLFPSPSDFPRMVESIRNPTTRGRSVSIGPQSAADAYETLAYRERKRRESVSSNHSLKSKSSNLELQSTHEDYSGKGAQASGAQANRIVEFEQMMGTGEVVTTPAADDDRVEIFVTGTEDGLGEREMFSQLIKPRVRYDVEVVTKLVVYTGKFMKFIPDKRNGLLTGVIGIAWFAVAIIPIMFEIRNKLKSCGTSNPGKHSITKGTAKTESNKKTSANMSDIGDEMDVDVPVVSKDVIFSSEAKQGKRSAANLPVEAEDSLPWVEKYRPNTLDDVSGHQDILATINKFIDQNRLPHLLLYGPPGTGKTSTILALARRIYGAANMRQMVLELNASDDRGIDVVREQIKTFASTKQIFSVGGASARSGNSMAGFKLIVLDEADAMTSTAQMALRRIMEKYTTNTRFCIIANYSHKLSPALLSRCTRFRFSPLKEGDIRVLVDKVVDEEHVRIGGEAVDALVKLSKGDMRRALNVLQACHASSTPLRAKDAPKVPDSEIERENITTETIYNCIAAPPPDAIKEIVSTLLKTSDVTSCLNTINALKVSRGLALADIITALSEELVKLEVGPEVMITWLDGLANIEHRVAGGGMAQAHATLVLSTLKRCAATSTLQGTGGIALDQQVLHTNTVIMTSIASSDAGNLTVEPLSERNVSRIPLILPHERVFPIQIGSELFKLSGASLSSDAPSYFSQYFVCQLESAKERNDESNSAIRTLYIDRDPAIFRDISLHLQGYHVQPRDGEHFVRLFSDAQFYSLPKLISQLYEESIFISIGHREFQIPREIFNDPGNSPNYFSLGFAAFFSRPDDLFPGLDREGLIRPPSILPPSVPKRSADTFAELLHFLRGYPIRIRDEAHRQDLLSDARYFHFKGLEQRLIPHSLSYNQATRRDEIVLRLENIQKSGVSVFISNTDPLTGFVQYARPYVDEKPAELVLEIGGETTKLHFSGSNARAEFFRDTKARVAKLFELVSSKLNFHQAIKTEHLSNHGQLTNLGNALLKEDLVRIVLEPESAIILDGKDYLEDFINAAASESSANEYPRKRKRADGDSGDEEWVVTTGQWRLRIQNSPNGKGVECILVAAKLDAMRSQLSRNMSRSFLGS